MAFLLAACAALLVSRGAFASDLAERALRATVRVSQGGRSGTGFFVALDGPGDARRTLLVSAAHLFEELEGETCSVVFRAAGGDQEFTRRESPLTIRAGGKPLWKRLPDVDVAAIVCEPPAGVDVAPFGRDQLASAGWAEQGKVRVGQEVCVPCFPARLEANAAGWPILRKGSLASHPLAKARTMFVDYAHFAGDSGAPVVAWIDERPVVVGLVIAMQRQTDRTVTPFEERTIHTSLGLAIAVPSPIVLSVIELWRAPPAP